MSAVLMSLWATLAFLLPVLQIGDQVVMPLALGAGAVLLLWYAAGNEIMRRRARDLALWCKRTTDPLGGRQAIKWLTVQSFRLELEELQAPFQAGAITGLTESWDVPMVWLWNRLRGRRDMVLLEVTLRRPPAWGLELYRPGTILSGDARRSARLEGWSEESLDEFRVAPGSGVPRDLAGRLLAELGDNRVHLVRLSVRRRDNHFALYLNVPDRTRLTPAQFHYLVRQLAESILHFAPST